MNIIDEAIKDGKIVTIHKSCVQLISIEFLNADDALVKAEEAQNQFMISLNK
jgi:hypothetical protein